MQTKFLSSLLVGVLFLLSILYFLEIRGEASNFLYSDYGKFYASARFAANHESLYTTIFFKEPKKNDPLSEVTMHRLPGNLNPPFFSYILYPLTLLTYKISLISWLIIAIGCGVLSATLIANTFNVEDLCLRLAIIVAVFAYYPSLITIQFGQVSLLLLPLLIIAWRAARNNHYEIAGICLGIAINIKLFFGLFIIYFLMRREWRALFWFGLTTIFCAALPLTFFKAKDYLDYHFILQHIWWYTSSWNASLYGFLLRIFGGGENEKNIPIVFLPSVTQYLHWFFSAMIMAGVCSFLRFKEDIDPKIKCDLDFSLVLVAMLLLAPLSWLYYFTLLMIPFAVLFHLTEKKWLPSGFCLITCFAIILSSIPFALTLPADIKNLRDIYLVSGVYFYSLVLLLGILFSTKFYLGRVNHKNPQMPSYLIILLYTMAFLPSFIGMLGIVHTLLADTQRYMQSMIIINRTLLELQ